MFQGPHLLEYPRAGLQTKAPLGWRGAFAFGGPSLSRRLAFLGIAPEEDL